MAAEGTGMAEDGGKPAGTFGYDKPETPEYKGLENAGFAQNAARIPIAVIYAFNKITGAVEPLTTTEECYLVRHNLVL